MAATLTTWRPVRSASARARSRLAAASSSWPLHSWVEPSRAWASVRWSSSAPLRSMVSGAVGRQQASGRRPGVGDLAGQPGPVQPGQAHRRSRAGGRPGERRLGGRGHAPARRRPPPARRGRAGSRAATTASSGLARTRSPGSRETSSPSMAAWPSASSGAQSVVSRRAAWSTSPAARAWRTAGTGWPASACQAGGPAVQARQLGGVPVVQLGPEQLGEQRVVAVPGPGRAGGRGEHVLALQPGQDPGPVGAAGQRVRQVAAEPVGDTRPEQERPQLGGLGGQHLLDQVAGDGPVVAGQVGHEPPWLGVLAQREGGQPQPGRPALGPPPQRLQLGPGQLDPVAGQQHGRLLEREGQVGLAELGELAGHPQPVQGQRRVGAAGHDQAELGGGVPEQEPELARHLWAGRLMQVVQDQHHRPVELQQAAHHRAKEPVADLGLRFEAGQEPVRGHGTGPAQRGQHLGPEPRRVLVARADPHPGHRARRPSPRRPRGQQEGLAVAGGRGQQGQRPLGALVQQPQQPLTGHRLPPRHRAPSDWWRAAPACRSCRCVREQLPARPNPPLALLLTARETVGGRTQGKRNDGASSCLWRSPSPASWRPRPTATRPTRRTCQDGRQPWSSPIWWPSATGRCRPRSWPRRCGAGPSRPPGGRPSAGSSARSGPSSTCSACRRPTP